MKKKNIQDLLDFQIKDGEVVSGNLTFCFYRFFPPNLSILTSQEKENEIDAFCSLLENSNMPIQIFALDKVEDLSENKAFFSAMNNKYAEYTETIIKQITNHETISMTNSIQRAYYFIVPIKNHHTKEIFEEALRTQKLKCIPCQKQELITVFRNFYLREFAVFDIYTFQEEIKKQYEEAIERKKHKA